MSDKSAKPYRLGVGIVLFNTDGKVFVGRRGDTVQAAWQFPQGGIDKGEDPVMALFREMREEIGTDKAEILGQTKEWLAYDLPADLAKKSWGGKYRGQKQLWFALRFTGTDADIDIATDHPEFVDWKWIDLAETPDQAVSFKRDLYVELVAQFTPLAH